MSSSAYAAFPQPFEKCPVSELDPYSHEALIDPWGAYAELQRLGSAVWLTKCQMFALTRYDSVRHTLCSDGPDHQRSRRVIGKPLTPMALKSLRDEITSKAERLVDGLVAKGTFCAITELATFLPVDMVASAVGLPHDGRERMLVWAAQMFNCFGPTAPAARSPCFRK
jgi:cytochrome P450